MLTQLLVCADSNIWLVLGSLLKHHTMCWASNFVQNRQHQPVRGTQSICTFKARQDGCLASVIVSCNQRLSLIIAVLLSLVL